MRHLLSLGALAVAVTMSVLGADPASAVPIQGTATVTGFDTINGSNLTNATTFTFVGSPSVSPLGHLDLATFVVGATATLDVNPWSFTPFTTQIPFLTLTNGLDQVVFDLDTSIIKTGSAGNDTASSLSLYLLGTLTPSGPGFAGLDPSAASVRFAATAARTQGG